MKSIRKTTCILTLKTVLLLIVLTTPVFAEIPSPPIDQYETLNQPINVDDFMKQDCVVTLKLLVVLYPRTFTWEMDNDSIANFHREVAQWIAWYDEIAGEKLHLDVDYIEIHTRINPLGSGPQGNDVYWMGPGDCDSDLLMRGIEPGIYDSVACFWAWDRDRGMKQAYGGGAIGPDSSFEFLGRKGRTSYFGSAVLKSHPDNVSKVAIHEYLHNLDSIFETAGYPDKFFSSDDMAINMRKLVEERPGAFKEYGYSDKDMIIMADKERRREAAFPWRTQLVYYRWMLERTPKEDFIRLLKQFGRWEKPQNRDSIYSSWRLPEGVKPFKVCLRENPKLEKSESSDIEKSDGFVHWKKDIWNGTFNKPDENTLVTYYKEAEIVVPDKIKIVIGESDFEIRGKVIDTVSGNAINNAPVSVEMGSGVVMLTKTGKLFGRFKALIDPMNLKPLDIKIIANVDGYECSKIKTSLDARTCWSLACEMCELASGEKGIKLKLDGPEGDYNLNITILPDVNYTQKKLLDDGFLRTASFFHDLTMKANTSIEIPLNTSDFPILEAEPVRVIVKWKSPDGKTYSYPHTFPSKIPVGNLLKLENSYNLPDYIPRAKKITPAIDGDLSEWSEKPSLHVTPENGNIFQGSFDNADDGSVELWLGYDSNNLYVAGKVRDDKLVNAGIWSADRINLVFDMLLDTKPYPYTGGSGSHTAWASDDYWVFMCPNMPDGPMIMRLGGRQPDGKSDGYYGPVTDSSAVVVKEDGGYHFEWIIPRSSLPFFNPESERILGFTFFYSDWDDDLSELMYLTNWGSPSGGIEWRFWDCGMMVCE
jgi:hypothetical protein